ncbi:hypothetical protein L7F22_009108 [Adiantum nelumboides]|nr:hypothetical protein [Adiantum nelumboides]
MEAVPVALSASSHGEEKGGPPRLPSANDIVVVLDKHHEKEQKVSRVDNAAELLNNVVVKVVSCENEKTLAAPSPSPLPVTTKVFDAEVVLPQRKSTFFQATLNCVSMLYGLGILSSPFAIAQAGWMGAILALGIATAYAYAAYLMSICARWNASRGGGTYQAVAQAALGYRAKGLITTLFYIEILGTLVGYCISMGDNLAYLFPHSGLSLPGLSGRNVMIFVAAMVMLPTVWVRDLSALSFTSMWCIASSVILLLAVLLSATVSCIGFHHPIPFIRLRGVPVAAGLYAFSFGGTSVFPSICVSMKDPSKFPRAVVLSFLIATASMVGLGIVGAYMFGQNTASQITLSMPIQFITTKIILWMTVATPMFKFALQLSPITTALETSLHQHFKASRTLLYGVSTLMRSMVLACIAIFSMIFPYFEYIVAFVGSSMTIAICLLFPCGFYLKIFWGNLKIKARVMIAALVLLGAIVGACGTVISVQGLINRRASSS